MIISWKDAQQRPNITHIIAQLVDSLSAKFDFEKVNQKAARAFLVKRI